MRLAWVSDLHVDHQPDVLELLADRALGDQVEGLVVGGDVTHHLDVLEGALRRLRHAYARVLFVPGNHDLWARTEPGGSRVRYLDRLPGLCRRVRVDYLPSGPVAIGDGTVVGQTGWYDYSMRDPRLEAEVAPDAYQVGVHGRLAWADKAMITWDGITDGELTAWMAARLEADLASVPRDRPVLVATHMLPFDGLAPTHPMEWAFVRGFLGATALGEAITRGAAAGARVERCLAGHSHHARRVEVAIGARTVVAETSPLGYPREYGRAGLTLPEQLARRVAIVELGAPALAA